MKIKRWSGAASLRHSLSINWHYWKHRKTCFLFGHPHARYTELGGYDGTYCKRCKSVLSGLGVFNSGYSHQGYWFHLLLPFLLLCFFAKLFHILFIA